MIVSHDSRHILCRIVVMLAEHGTNENICEETMSIISIC